MIRNLLCAAMICTLCGCMIANNDRAAAKAVAVHAGLQKNNPPAKLTIAEVLSSCNSKRHNQLRRELARLHCARELVKLYRNPLQMDKLRQAMLDMEKARIQLNYSLKFLPEIQISYDTAGAFEVPAELPEVAAFEKAILVADATECTALSRLVIIRQYHADAVAAYDAVLHAATPADRTRREYQRLLRCADLADAAGTTLADLPEITTAANRFDAFKKHQVTSR